MNIKPYDPSHLEGVARLSLRAWAPVFDSLQQVFAPAVYDTFYPQGWRVSQDKAVRDVCAAADFKVWVAIESETVAGFVALRYHAADKLGEIHMIAVDPDFQRRGIGLAMTDFAVERMKEAGMTIAMVETGGDSGHEPARAAYAKAGFGLFPVARYFKKL
ncbi:MAG TPA: GNAT family N-acetyltransferase [Steroidobacteraceae bacterium]|nr:GNAT family N-acetyltransferase [Steroidobacteraceae bacterium]